MTSKASIAGSGSSPPHPPPPKQIRFVNNEGQPPPKRRRINAACLTCRKRKTRCDGRKPLCSTCSENGHECMGYTDPAEGLTKRDVKAEDITERGNNDAQEIQISQSDRRAIQSLLESRKERPGAHSTGSPELITADLKPPNFEANKRLLDTRDIGQPKSGNISFVEYKDGTAFSEGITSAERSPSLHTESNTVPYFRYFGPTAIVPGFKQMVVSVRESRRSTASGSSVEMSPASSGYGGVGSASGMASHIGTELRPSTEMPIYDQNDPNPVNKLIIHLVETFFDHLGCNYPFLRSKSFIPKVEEKAVEPVLVDAICAVAARFSDSPLLTLSGDASYPKSEYGHVFAQRAKAAVVDTFPCPTVAAVQACLLLAYESFGSNQDSALWMYLGCAIRMAVDLGLQKLDGVKHQGPKDPGYRGPGNNILQSNRHATISDQEKHEVEQERADTMWAVFILDRVISSGTGRPVTLRDEDFELEFPLVTSNVDGAWPNPFPALIQIIHLYGRVSDLLNNIHGVKDVTPRLIKGLSMMEKDLTTFYQKLDSRLTFNATNFQHYVKSGEGTNFILVHFWFHTLIMLVHQPTLMHSFEGQIIQLLPNSRELSMSSAKTIADILAFAELIDPRTFVCNPFTSQPMYVAACAFLIESAAHTSSRPTSRDYSPPHSDQSKDDRVKASAAKSKSSEQKQKHSLLASAANQNYRQCYKALEQLEVYWAGIRYILVALDQKAKGIWDPETYTEQEYESTKPRNNMIPNWSRRLSLVAPSPGRLGDSISPRVDMPGSPSQAIGWAITGTTNSPQSSLTFMYQNLSGEHNQTIPPPPSPPPVTSNAIYNPILSSAPAPAASHPFMLDFQPRYSSYNEPPHLSSQHMPPPTTKYPSMSSEPASTSDAEMLLGLQSSPFAHQTQNSQSSYEQNHHMTSQAQNLPAQNRYDFSQNNSNDQAQFSGSNGYMGIGGFGDMMMESQDIDMSALNGDVMPYLEYLPQDILNYFVMPTMNSNTGMENMDSDGG